MAAGFKTATVNASDVPATQTDFPAYVDLSRLGITTLAEAQSVRVYADSAKTTEWAREIVSATEMHVKIPSLTSTTSIYVDWDGVSADYAATDTYGRNAVWSDYGLIAHLQANGDDSTGTNTDTENSMTYTSSKIENGGSFNGTSSRITYPDDASLRSTGNFTLSVWFRTTTSKNQGLVQLWSQPSGSEWNGIRMWVLSSKLRIDIGSASLFNFDTTISSWTDGNWRKLTAVFDGTTARLYVNGSQLNSASTSNAPTYTSAIYPRIGVLNNDGSELTTFSYNGGIDEARFRADDISANWETTEYNNQSDEAGFWGTWTDAGGGGGVVLPQFKGFARL